MKQLRQHHTAVLVQVLMPDPEIHSCITHIYTARWTNEHNTQSLQWSVATHSLQWSVVTQYLQWSVATQSLQWPVATQSLQWSVATQYLQWSVATQSLQWSVATQSLQWSVATQSLQWSVATQSLQWSVATLYLQHETQRKRNFREETGTVDMFNCKQFLKVEYLQGGLTLQWIKWSWETLQSLYSLQHTNIQKTKQPTDTGALCTVFVVPQTELGKQTGKWTLARAEWRLHALKFHCLEN